MIITAKFSSVCPKCQTSIESGEKIEWERGSKATHVACPEKSAAKSDRPAATGSKPRTTGAPSVSDAPYVRCEKWEPCKRVALPDTTGEVRVATRSPVPGVKAPWADVREGAKVEPAREGEAFKIVGQTAYYENAEQNEDCGDMTGPGWQVTLYLRRATAEEAAPAIARYAAKREAESARAARVAMIRELVRLCEAGMRVSDNAANKPTGREFVVDPGVNGSGQKIAVLSEDGHGAAIWCSGYYDDYRPTLAVTREPRAAEVLRTLLEGVS